VSVNIAKRWPDMLLVNPMNEAVTGNGVSALRRKEITKVAVRAASMRPMAMKFRMEHLTTSLSHSRRGAKLRRSQGAKNLPDPPKTEGAAAVGCRERVRHRHCIFNLGVKLTIVSPTEIAHC